MKIKMMLGMMLAVIMSVAAFGYSYNNAYHVNTSGSDTFMVIGGGFQNQTFDNAWVYINATYYPDYITATISINTYNGSTMNPYNYVLVADSFMNTSSPVDLNLIMQEAGVVTGLWMGTSLNLGQAAVQELEDHINAHFGH